MISNGEEIKGNPSSGLVPRKSVNPSDKASSPIDRQQGSMVGYEIIFKLSLVEPVGKERIITFNLQSSLRTKLHGKPQMRPSIQAFQAGKDAEEGLY